MEVDLLSPPSNPHPSLIRESRLLSKLVAAVLRRRGLSETAAVEEAKRLLGQPIAGQHETKGGRRLNI